MLGFGVSGNEPGAVCAARCRKVPGPQGAGVVGKRLCWLGAWPLALPSLFLQGTTSLSGVGVASQGCPRRRALHERAAWRSPPRASPAPGSYKVAPLTSVVLTAQRFATRSGCPAGPSTSPRPLKLRPKLIHTP